MHEYIGNIVNDLQNFVHTPTMMMTKDDASSKLIFPLVQLQFFLCVHCSKKRGDFEMQCMLILRCFFLGESK